MALALVARKDIASEDLANNAAWNIFEGSMQIPSYIVIAGDFNWEIKAQPGPYGVSFDQEDAVRDIQAKVRRTMQLRDVLAIVRGTLEAQYEMHRQEALAEQETERRAEQFWENRMSDEDKAREDWEYSMYGA